MADLPKIEVQGKTQQADVAQLQLDNLDLQKKVDELTAQVEAFGKTLADKDTEIKKFQELNQQLFLRVAAPMQQEPQGETADPLVKSALDKIEKYNQSLKEQK